MGGGPAFQARKFTHDVPRWLAQARRGRPTWGWALNRVTPAVAGSPMRCTRIAGRRKEPPRAREQ